MSAPPPNEKTVSVGPSYVRSRKQYLFIARPPRRGLTIQPNVGQLFSCSLTYSKTAVSPILTNSCTSHRAPLPLKGTRHGSCGDRRKGGKEERPLAHLAHSNRDVAKKFSRPTAENDGKFNRQQDMRVAVVLASEIPTVGCFDLTSDLGLSLF